VTFWRNISLSPGLKSKASKKPAGSKALLGFSLVDFPNFKLSNEIILNGMVVKFSC
jgi:hypothetical protein